MPTVRIQEKNYSESIMVLKLKDGTPRGRVVTELAYRHLGLEFPG